MPNTSPDPLTAITSGYHDAVRAQRAGAASVDARLWLSMARAADRLGADGMARDCAARAYAMATGREVAS